MTGSIMPLQEGGAPVYEGAEVPCQNASPKQPETRFVDRSPRLCKSQHCPRAQLLDQAQNQCCWLVTAGMTWQHAGKAHLVDALEVLVRLAVENEDDVARLHVRLVAPRLAPQRDLRLVLHALSQTSDRQPISADRWVAAALRIVRDAVRLAWQHGATDMNIGLHTVLMTADARSLA